MFKIIFIILKEWRSHLCNAIFIPYLHHHMQHSARQFLYLIPHSAKPIVDFLFLYSKSSNDMDEDKNEGMTMVTMEVVLVNLVHRGFPCKLGVAEKERGWVVVIVIMMLMMPIMMMMMMMMLVVEVVVSITMMLIMLILDADADAAATDYDDDDDDSDDDDESILASLFTAQEQGCNSGIVLPHTISCCLLIFFLF